MSLAPTLTVFTPCYDHAAYVAQAIRAVQSQSRPTDEHLVLDDASTDDSAAVIESLQRQTSSPSFDFLRHDENRGAVASLQELVRRARGDYVYAAAADDMTLPGFFAQAMELAVRYPRAGVLFGAMRGMDAVGRLGRTYALRGCDSTCCFTPDEYRRQALDRQPAYRSLSGATIFRRDCLLEVGGFRQELGHWCDTFAIQAIALKYGAVYCPTPWMAWRRLPNSFSANTLGDWRGRLAIIDSAAALMRSDEFRDRFPADYVARWRRRSARAIALRCVKELASRGVQAVTRRAA